MAPLGRPGLSAQQKKERWFRWTQGQSLSEIGPAVPSHHHVDALSGAALENQVEELEPE